MQSAIPKWSIDQPIADYDEVSMPKVIGGEPNAKTFWFRADLDWLTALEKSHNFRAGLSIIERSSYEIVYRDFRDLYILEGSAVVDVEGFGKVELGPGDAAAFNLGAKTSWTVAATLKYFFVMSRSPSSKAHDWTPVTATAWVEDEFEKLPPKESRPNRYIRWLRKESHEPDQQGSSAGLFLFEPGQYGLQFSASEWVLMLGGEQLFEVNGSPVTLQTGDIAAFQKGLDCLRTIKEPVKEFFVAV